jgi:hypothetical protein
VGALRVHPASAEDAQAAPHPVDSDDERRLYQSRELIVEALVIIRGRSLISGSEAPNEGAAPSR